MNNSKTKTRLTAPTILQTLEEHKDELRRMGVLKIGLFDCPVDLVMEETIKPRLRPTILGAVVYASGF